MSDRIITENIFVSDGNAVFEFSGEDTVTVVADVSVESGGTGGRAIAMNGNGDTVLMRGRASAFEGIGIEVGTDENDLSGDNLIRVFKTASVFGQETGILVHPRQSPA